MNLPLISVIIVNWNGAAYLHTCLAALDAQTYAPIEIIMIDNASTDHSCEVIEAFRSLCANRFAAEPSRSHPDLRFIRNTRNEGFCRGNNQGIHASGGEFVLLLNADVVLDSQFIERLVQIMHSDQSIGIALGKLLSGSDPMKIDSTGIVIRKTRRAFDRGQREDDTGQYQRIEEVFGASGAACLYRRAMLEDIKYSHTEYLDELFFAYKEDVDLSWRARLCGWKCVYTPDAVGWHYRKWGTGKRKDIPIGVRRHSLKNRYVMMLKNEQRDTFWPHVLPIFWYELRSLGYILVREPYLCAVLGDILRVWPNIMQKRKITQQKSLQRGACENMLPWFQ